MLGGSPLGGGNRVRRRSYRDLAPPCSVRDFPILHATGFEVWLMKPIACVLVGSDLLRRGRRAGGPYRQTHARFTRISSPMPANADGLKNPHYSPSKALRAVMDKCRFAFSTNDAHARARRLACCPGRPISDDSHITVASGMSHPHERSRRVQYRCTTTDNRQWPAPGPVALPAAGLHRGTWSVGDRVARVPRSWGRLLSRAPAGCRVN